MRHCAFVVLLALSFSGAVTLAAPAPGEPAPPRDMPRVRPHDARAASLLLRGIERSSTIRGLVARLEEHDVIVYVEMQPALKRLAGRLVFLTTAGNFRYVRISLSPEIGAETLVAVLGHELRHALEVATAPAIVDEPSLEAYYRKHGINMRSHASGWDTQAARDAGELVRKEIAGGPAVSALASMAPVDAAEWNVVYRRARDRFGAR